MKGRLLSLEGISGTGKTFYREQLEKNLKDKENIIFIKEIFNEAQEGLNKKIFDALYHTEDRFFNMGVPLTETMLLLSRSMYKYESTIRQALESGKTVIEDRSIDTIALYQAILIAQKNGGNPLEIADKIYSFAGNFRRLPQQTFLLCGNPDLAISRAEKRDGIPYKPDEVKLLKAVDKFYSIYADNHPERFIKIDISKEDSNQILNKIQNIIEGKNLEERGEKAE